MTLSAGVTPVSPESQPPLTHPSKQARPGRPLTSYDVIINTIGALSTRTGLTAAAVLDHGAYPAGRRISDAQMKDIEDRCLTRHGFRGEWNYTLLAAPRPAPPPEPGPPRPAPAWRCGQDTLNHPALTGISPQALAGLAAALEIPYQAHREQRRYHRMGQPRQRAGGPRHNRRLDLTDHLLATLIRRHLNLPASVIAAILGADRTTVSHAITRTATILAAGIPQPPAAPPPAAPPRTLAELRDYAARHGITITSPPDPAGTDTTPHATLTTPDTP
jgi:hypothetical protein